MTKSQATAAVFVTAFKSLPKRERDEVLVMLASDRAIQRDLADLVIIQKRRREPSRPLRDVLAGLEA